MFGTKQNHEKYFMHDIFSEKCFTPFVIDFGKYSLPSDSNFQNVWRLGIIFLKLFLTTVKIHPAWYDG